MSSTIAILNDSTKISGKLFHNKCYIFFNVFLLTSILNFCLKFRVIHSVSFDVFEVIHVSSSTGTVRDGEY